MVQTKLAAWGRPSVNEEVAVQINRFDVIVVRKDGNRLTSLITLNGRRLHIHDGQTKTFQHGGNVKKVRNRVTITGKNGAICDITANYYNNRRGNSNALMNVIITVPGHIHLHNYGFCSNLVQGGSSLFHFRGGIVPNQDEKIEETSDEVAVLGLSRQQAEEECKRDFPNDHNRYNNCVVDRMNSPNGGNNTIELYKETIEREKIDGGHVGSDESEDEQPVEQSDEPIEQSDEQPVEQSDEPIEQSDEQPIE
jgi:hypothetical protein